MIAVDASVWVSLYMEQDRFHQESRDWLARQLSAHQDVIAPGLLLVEVSGAMARLTNNSRRGHDAAHRLRQTRTLRLLPLDDRRRVSAARVAADTHLRGADATYVAIAHEFDVPLVTWDQEQRDRGALIVPTYTPRTYAQRSSW